MSTPQPEVKRIEPAKLIKGTVDGKGKLPQLCANYLQNPRRILQAIETRARQVQAAIQKLGLSIEFDKEKSPTFAEVRQQLVDEFGKLKHEISGENDIFFLETVAQIHARAFEALHELNERKATESEQDGDNDVVILEAEMEVPSAVDESEPDETITEGEEGLPLPGEDDQSNDDDSTEEGELEAEVEGAEPEEEGGEFDIKVTP
ncbi:MAG: hypothetical protein ABIA92_02820 [Patescibacteria group bacterium]